MGTPIQTFEVMDARTEYENGLSMLDEFSGLKVVWRCGDHIIAQEYICGRKS